MKTNKFIAFAMASILLVVTGCKTEEPIDPEATPESMTLSALTLSVAVGETGTLAAAFLPAGTSATITWVSQDESVATVNNGVVTGVKEGSTTIVATAGSLVATCAVTVTKGGGGSTDESLLGSNYYVFVLDETSLASIDGKVVADLRPNESTKFLYVWDNTYVAGTPVGPNFYGQLDGWTALVVNNVGWSGCGFFSAAASGGFDFTAIDATYTLHLGIKSQDTGVHSIILNDGGGNEYRAVLGNRSDGDGVAPWGDFTRNGEWQEVEIPMSYFLNKGLTYRSTIAEGNSIAFLSGGIQGTVLNVDALFIYKK